MAHVFILAVRMNRHFNYDSEANADDGSCYPVIEGCTDPDAFNFIQLTGNVMVDVNTEDSSCYPVIEGCMDPNAFNFNDYDNNNVFNEFTGDKRVRC